MVFPLLPLSHKLSVVLTMGSALVINESLTLHSVAENGFICLRHSVGVLGSEVSRFAFQIDQLKCIQSSCEQN